jgi:hypothetical protein
MAPDSLTTTTLASTRLSRRFEGIAKVDPDKSWQVADTCAGTRVTERTLRLDRQEQLAIDLCLFLELQRIELLQRALASEPIANIVAVIANNYGLPELGALQFATEVEEAASATPKDRPGNRSILD